MVKLEKDITATVNDNSKSFANTMAELAIRLKENDKKAFEDFYEASANYIYCTIKRTAPNCNEDDIQDLMQETYIKIFSNIKSLRDPQGAAKWIKTITVNTTVDYLRKASTRYEFLLKEEDDPLEGINSNDLDSNIMIPEDIIDNKVTQKIVIDTFKSLPLETQTICARYYFYEESIKDIATSLGIKENTVKSILFRGRRTMEGRFLKIEKEQGIRLRSVGIVPFMLWLFYMLTKAEPISETTKAETKEKVIRKIRNQGSSKLTKTSTGLFSSIALKTVIATVIIIAAVAGIIIGITAKNKSEKETVQEETTSEAVQETAETKNPETILMYQEYYEIITECIAIYGDGEILEGYTGSEEDEEEAYEDTSNWYQYYIGLCCAQLFDFNDDGSDELYIVYGYIDEENYLGISYNNEIWGFEEGEVILIYSGEVYDNIVAGNNGQWYLTDDQSRGEEYTEQSFYVCENGECVLYKNFLIFSDEWSNEDYEWLAEMWALGEYSGYNDEYETWIEENNITTLYTFYVYHLNWVTSGSMSAVTNLSDENYKDTIVFLEEYLEIVQ